MKILRNHNQVLILMIVKNQFVKLNILKKVSYQMILLRNIKSIKAIKAIKAIKTIKQ